MAKLRKAGAVLSAMALTAGLIGCGNAEEEQVSTTTSPTNESATTNDSVVEAPLKFSMSLDANDNPYALKLSNVNQDQYVQEVNKQANVEMNLKILSHKDYSQQMQLMFASGEIPDMVWNFGDYTDQRISTAVQSGVFMELGDLIGQYKDELPNLMNAIPEEAWEQSKYEGKIYGIPVGYSSYGHAEATYIRKDLLEKYNLEVPATLDEMLNVLKVFKENGMKYPYLGREQWSFTDTFFLPFGVYPNRWQLVGDQILPDVIRPEMKEALAYHVMLREEGLMDPESITTSSNDWSNKIKAGEIGVFMHKPVSLETFNVSLKEHIPDAEYMLIPSIKGPNGEGGSFISPLVSSSVYINKDFKEPLRLLKFLDWQASEEAQKFFAFGMGGQDNYSLPTDAETINEFNFLSTLNVVKDTAYNKYTAPLSEDGQAVARFYEEIAPNEGYHAYKILDRVDVPALKKYPDLKTNDLFFQYAAKIFLGNLPIDAFDEFVTEFKKRGGDELIAEANQLYQEGKLIKY